MLNLGEERSIFKLIRNGKHQLASRERKIERRDHHFIIMREEHDPLSPSFFFLTFHWKYCQSTYHPPNFFIFFYSFYYETKREREI